MLQRQSKEHLVFQQEYQWYDFFISLCVVHLHEIEEVLFNDAKKTEYKKVSESENNFNFKQIFDAVDNVYAVKWKIDVKILELYKLIERY